MKGQGELMEMMKLVKRLPDLLPFRGSINNSVVGPATPGWASV